MGVLTGCSIVRIFFTIIISLFIVIIVIIIGRLSAASLFDRLFHSHFLFIFSFIVSLFFCCCRLLQRHRESSSAFFFIYFLCRFTMHFFFLFLFFPFFYSTYALSTDYNGSIRSLSILLTERKMRDGKL